MSLAITTGSKAAGVTCYLLTDNNHILTFKSDSPGTIISDVTVSGPDINMYSLVGMDIRPTVQPGSSNPGAGSLWALGTDGMDFRIYVINPATGVSVKIGATLTGINGNGSGPDAWFFGFNPTTDRIQMLNFQKNYQVDPNKIATSTDYLTLPSFSTVFPNSNGSAFTTAAFGSPSKAYLVDQSPMDSLISPNFSAGTYTTIGDTGLSFSAGAGLDIDGSATLLAATVGMTAGLYNVDRISGAATSIGAIGTNPKVRALTIKPTAFPTPATVTAKIKKPKSTKVTKKSLVIKGTATSQAGIKSVQYKISGGKFKFVKGNLTKWKFTAKLKAGKNLISVKATGKNGVVSKLQKIKITRLAP